MKFQALAGALAASFLVAGTGVASSAHAGGAPAYITAAVADPNRPAADIALDADRKPAAILTFIGLKPGDKVVDFFGGAYWDRLFSRVVGPTGRVTTFQATEMAKALKQTLPVPGSKPYPEYPNIVAQSRSINDLHPGRGDLDMVWMRQNYHDMYDPFMGPANVPAVDNAIFTSLKHSGVFVVIDHSAPDGSGLASTNTTHRIDEAVVKKDLASVGFELVAESNLYRNPADTRDRHSSENDDRFILVFRKP
jgi:predicted methyltransferase